MPEFWMCLLQYMSYTGHCTNYGAVIIKQECSEHCQTFKMERFTKRILPECRLTTRSFQGIYMSDRLLKMPHVLNISEFWIWHRCICKGYKEFWMSWIWLIIPKKCLNISQYARMSLNMPKHDLVLLNALEYAWKCLNKLFWVCQGSQYTSLF